MKRLKGEWTTFTDTGEEFIDNNNKYLGDLDIFGKNSLFQWINTSFTYTGRINLKDKLLKPAKDIEEIKLKQEAINELSKTFISPKINGGRSKTFENATFR